MARITARGAALAGIFASLHIILYLIPAPAPLWRNWAVFLEPIAGIILGPWIGYLAALVGSAVARAIVPTEFWMFGIFAEPIGALTAGLLSRGIWKPVLAIYCIMLSAYFIHPLGRWLPLWPMTDIFVALVLIYPTAKISRKLLSGGIWHLTATIALIALVSTVTDSLARVFLFIPIGLYSLFFPTWDIVYIIFIGGAIGSFIEDALAVLINGIVGPPIIARVRRIPWFRALLGRVEQER